MARMAALLAGLPDSSGGVTVNRLCGSGLDAVAMAARAIRGGEAELIIAGGVGKHEPRAVRHAQGRPARSTANAEIYDTTIGWRFVNPKMRDAYGDDTMPETAENVADEYQDQPRGPGRVRAAQPAARRRRAGQRPPRRRDRRRSKSRSARAIRSSSTATSIRAPPASRRSPS